MDILLISCKNTKTKIKISLDELKSRLKMSEKRACELEDRSIEIIHYEH